MTLPPYITRPATINDDIHNRLNFNKKGTKMRDKEKTAEILRRINLMTAGNVAG